MAISTISNASFGNDSIINANGIKFPATQVPSADANTLDDYEEGSWTPTIGTSGGTTGSPTYTTQVGRYTKVGSVVMASCTLSFSKNTLSGGYIDKVDGLPFTTLNVTSNYWIGNAGWYNPSGTSWLSVGNLLSPNTPRIDITRMTTAGVDAFPSALPVSEIGTSLSLYITITYMATA